MTKDDIRLLYQYDRWANNRVIEFVSALTPEQFTRDLGGTFQSVRHALVHIAAGEWVWLPYWKADSYSIPFVNGRSDVTNCSIRSYIRRSLPWKRNGGRSSKEQLAFVESVTDESLNRMLPFRTTQVSLAHLMQHVANHSTYHRGQIALMMRQLNAEPIPTDFHAFLVEDRTQP